MALKAYCKKCRKEVSPGEICPLCGTKLARTATHAAWVVERRPVADWMCWNAVARWLIPAGLAVLLLALILEGIAGGLAAVEKLFQGSFPVTLLVIFCVLALLVLLDLTLQGRELMDYVVDSRGVHVTRYLPDPTALKLLARGKSPALLNRLNPETENPVLPLEERDLPWKEISRVQLWPEKCYVLFYAPAWWLRIPVRCTPFSWDDVMGYIREKLGKKKAVERPAHLRVQAEKKTTVRRSGTRAAVPAAVPLERSVPRTGIEEEDGFSPWEDDSREAGSASAVHDFSFPEESADDPGQEKRQDRVPDEMGEQLAMDLEER